MYDENIMRLSAKRAQETMRAGQGGPFGAAIVRHGEIIAIESNTVLADNDPTAHAEINAIRAACQVLGTHDLHDCELYATGYPCPMCLSAIIWANIKTVYVSGSVESAENIGFRDLHIYNYIEHCRKETQPNDPILNIYQEDPVFALSLYEEYAESHREIY